MLNGLLDDLEDKLDPLFAQSLPDSLHMLSDLHQAKLQTVLPYIVYDLVFIYLKSAGIDPRSHSVVSELERVRQYFEKIKTVETPEPDPARNTAIDKEAAARFIKHAIAQAPSNKTAVDDEAHVVPPAADVPVKVTQKMLDRAQYQKELREQSQDEELQVFDDDNPSLEDADRTEKRKTRRDRSPDSTPKKNKKKKKLQA